MWNILGVALEDRPDSIEPDVQHSVEPGILAIPEKHANFRDLFSRDVRRRTIIAVFLMGFLQLCGIDAVLYVSLDSECTTVDIVQY